MGEKGKSKGSKTPQSFVLRTYMVGGMGVRELHLDWLLKVMPASPWVDMITQTWIFVGERRYLWGSFPGRGHGT